MPGDCQTLAAFLSLSAVHKTFPQGARIVSLTADCNALDQDIVVAGLASFLFGCKERPSRTQTDVVSQQVLTPGRSQRGAALKLRRAPPTPARPQGHLQHATVVTALVHLGHCVRFCTSVEQADLVWPEEYIYIVEEL